MCTKWPKIHSILLSDNVNGRLGEVEGLLHMFIIYFELIIQVVACVLIDSCNSLLFNGMHNWVLW